MPKFTGKRPKIQIYTADKWFSRCIRLRASNLCECCHGETSDCAHIYGRANFAVRWDINNAISLCRPCHNRFGDNPCDWTDFVDLRWPGRRELCQVKMRGFFKNSPENRKLVADHYRKEYHRMQSPPAGIHVYDYLRNF